MLSDTMKPCVLIIRTTFDLSFDRETPSVRKMLPRSWAMVGESMWSEAFMRDVGRKWSARAVPTRAVIAAIFYSLSKSCFFLNVCSERYSA